MAGSGVSAESPVVRRMHDAVFELNAAEAALVSDLAGASVDEADELVWRAYKAREEFEGAFAELQAALMSSALAGEALDLALKSRDCLAKASAYEQVTSDEMVQTAALAITDALLAVVAHMDVP